MTCLVADKCMGQVGYNRYPFAHFYPPYSYRPYTYSYRPYYQPRCYGHAYGGGYSPMQLRRTWALEDIADALNDR